MVFILILVISIKGHINFSQLSPYSEKGEKYFRNNFTFLEFNKIVLLRQGCDDLTITVDYAYHIKSGEKTFGLVYSACAFCIRWGL